MFLIGDDILTVFNVPWDLSSNSLNLNFLWIEVFSRYQEWDPYLELTENHLDLYNLNHIMY